MTAPHSCRWASNCRWQYNGAAPFNEIVSWCFQHFGSKVTWSYLNETIYFKDEREYTLFLLRWS
jgi:hypothetical protein